MFLHLLLLLTVAMAVAKVILFHVHAKLFKMSMLMVIHSIGITNPFQHGTFVPLLLLPSYDYYPSELLFVSNSNWLFDLTSLWWSNITVSHFISFTHSYSNFKPFNTENFPKVNVFVSVTTFNIFICYWFTFKSSQFLVVECISSYSFIVHQMNESWKWNLRENR